MIAKGIVNPTTGDVAQVQGAGIVYNEENNSIAIGKGTVAGGKDQFVCGRDNVEDTTDTYAEIVGGGSSTQKTGFTAGDKATVSYTTGNPRRAVENVLTVEYLGTRASNVVPALKALTSWATNPEDIAALEDEYGEDYYLIKHVWSIKTATSGSYAYFLGSDNALDPQGGSHCFVYTSNAGAGIDVYTKEAEVESSLTKANIRTLDWSGNEKLAGNLEVGGTLKIGSTTITSAQLAALLELLDDESGS